VTDAGLKHLKECKTLGGLDLRNTAVSDESVKTLSGLSQLKTLNLRKTRFTAKGIDELKKALPKCKIEWQAENEKK
jgi:hypothetical protein